MKVREKESKEKNFISAVIYVRNNADILDDFIDKLNKILSEHFLKYELIFVNDGSIDDSVKVIKKRTLSIKNAAVNIINMSFYQGKEMAMNAGIDLAIGDFVYEFDTVYIDYDIETIFKIYEKSLEGYDIVNASPNKRRRTSSAIFYKLFNKYSNYMYNIDTYTFKIISRRAINRIYAVNKTVPYRKAIEASCGLKMNTVKYKINNNSNSKIDSSLHKEREKTAIDSLILFTDIAYKMALGLSILMILLVVIVGIYTVFIFINKQPIEGWTTTMLFLALGFFGIFAILTIIIKYLTVILNLIFKRSNYLIESIEKVN